MGNYRPFLQGPLPVANYMRIIIPGRFWTRPPSTKSTRMASSATPLHDSLIELAIPDAHAHAIKWYLKAPVFISLTVLCAIIRTKTNAKWHLLLLVQRCNSKPYVRAKRGLYSGLRIWLRGVATPTTILNFRDQKSNHEIHKNKKKNQV